MMSILRGAILLALFVQGRGDDMDGCVMGEWSEWSEWRTETVDHSITSHPSPPRPIEAEIDMEETMLRHREMIKQCRDDETCPLYLERPSEGRVDCVDGFANDLECWNVNQMSFINISMMHFNPDIQASPFGNENWGWTDPADGEEYAMLGLTTGTSFIRITDPENPVVVGHLETHNNDGSFWRDFKTIGNYVYIVAEVLDHGIQVFDLHKLRGVTTPTTFTPDTHYDQVGSCHNVVTNEETNFVYAVACNRGNYTNQCDGGLHVVDVTDPLNPTFAGCFGGDGYVHDAQCVIYRGPDAQHFGQELCFCYNEDDFTIVDVSDKANMNIVSRTTYAGATYTHQGWLTEDQSIVVMDDERDERDTEDKITKTYVWDVQDLDAPVLMSVYRAPVESIDHNQYTKDGYTYQANLLSGLRVLSIDPVTYNLTLVAYFDAFPGVNEATFGGAWNVYPYYDSGVVILSTAEYGLFILRPDYPAMEQAAHSNIQYAESRRSRDILQGRPVDCPPLTEVRRNV